MVEQWTKQKIRKVGVENLHIFPRCKNKASEKKTKKNTRLFDTILFMHTFIRIGLYFVYFKKNIDIKGFNHVTGFSEDEEKKPRNVSTHTHS